MMTSLSDLKFFTFESKQYAVNTKTQELHFVNPVDNTLSETLPIHPSLTRVRAEAEQI